MPSGKQISFENGEISPSLRFRTSLASYSTGLASCFNKTIRKAGGASNRAGFELVSIPAYDEKLKTPHSIKLFGAVLPPEEDQAQANEIPAIILTPEDGAKAVEIFSPVPFTNTIGNSGGQDLTNVKMSQIGATLIFSNGTEHWAYIREGTTVKNKTIVGPIPDYVAGASTFAIGTFATTTNLAILSERPVMYAVFQVLRTGEEILYALFDNYTPKGGGSLTGLPIEPQRVGDHQSHNVLTLTLSADTSVKNYNIYRAARGKTQADPMNWGLVGRVPTPSSDSNIEFADYLSFPDLRLVPPNEKYLYGEFTPTGLGMPIGGGTIGVPAVDHYRELVSARLVGHHQQRRFIVTNPSTSKLTEGSIVCSKLGAVDQLDTGIFFFATEAFDFKIPIGERQRVVAMVELKKLIVMTNEAVIVVWDGEEGIITPNSVNPIVISHVGCSETVTPVRIGDAAYFMSKNNERLMTVVFNSEGAAVVEEISIFSDHLLERSDIVQMAVTKGKEDNIWLLNDRGQLRSIVVHEGGQVTGWARHETNGFVESIAVVKQDRPLPLSTSQQIETYDALIISVVREGVRYVERSVYREDVDSEQFTYMDSHMTFGSRLLLDSEASQYRKVVDLPLPAAIEVDNHVGRLAYPVETAQASKRINIEDGTATWDETVDITLRNLDTGNFTPIATGSQVIDFYYDELADPSDPNSEAIAKTIRWKQNGYVSADEATGRFDGPVPAQIRDVDAQIIALPSFANEGKLLQTRWARVKKLITGLGHLANREVSVFADGIVVSSPNNPIYDTLTVDGSGELELDDYYAWGVVGLAYESEIETLDLDTSDERTFTDSRKLVNRVGVALHESKGGFIGQTGSGTDLTKMEELLIRTDESLEEVTKNINEHVAVPIPAQWEKTGRILIKQVDPLPMTVLAVYPKGIAGD